MAFKLSSLALAASLAAVVLALPGPPAFAQVPSSQVRLPALGEPEADSLGIGDERRIGDQIMRTVAGDPDIVDDPLLTEYVGSIFHPLLDAARKLGNVSPDEDSEFAWKTFLVRDRTFNAFALPGGYIGIHLGLIAATGSADELASVIGHELSHVTQRHIARTMANSRQQTLLATLGMVLGLLAAARSANSDVPMAIMTSAQAAAASGQLKFSRAMESEADRFGMEDMTEAGFAPRGMASMFERLESASRLNDTTQYPWLQTHPLTTQRLAEARLRAQGDRAATSARNRPVEHQLMRERARALMDPTEGPLRRMQQEGRHAAGMPTADRLGSLYGGAMASLLLRDFDGAAQMLDTADKLLAVLPARPVAPATPDAATASAPDLPATLAPPPHASISGASAPAAAAPARGASDAAARLPQAGSGGGAPLYDTGSTAPGPAVDAGSEHVRRDFALLRLQLAIARKRSAAEVASAAAALPDDHSRPVLLALGDSAVARSVAHDPGAPQALHRETEQLQTWVSLHPHDALAWSTLSLCADASGLKLRAIRAEAEAHAAEGDINGAIDRLQAGQRLARGPSTDFVEASIIDTRLRALEAQRRELRKEQGGRE